SCDGVSCNTTCNGGYKLCGGVCAPCDISGTSYACAGTSCVITACGLANHLCSGSCVPNYATTSCGTSCSPCAATPAHATATCDGYNCGFTCDSGYLTCGNGCCPDCRVAGNTCPGVTWCQPSGLCEAVQKLEPAAADATAYDNFGQAVDLDGTSVLV